MPKFSPQYLQKCTACCCAFAAGMTLSAVRVEGQQRVAPPGGGATLQASVTILPSLDGASFLGDPRDVARASDQTFVSRRTLVVSAAGPADGATPLPRRLDPPVARSFERFALEGRAAVRHTIAVLY